MLSELRKQREMTQAQLAEKLGMSRVQLSHMENKNPENMRLGTAIKLARVLGVKPEDLLEKNEA